MKTKPTWIEEALEKLEALGESFEHSYTEAI